MSKQASVRDLSSLLANARPASALKKEAGRPTGEAASAIGRKNMIARLSAHHDHADNVTFIPCRQSSPDGSHGVLSSAGHNVIHFYLMICPLCPETIQSGPDKGQTRDKTVLVAGQGEINRYVFGDGTSEASVTSPLRDPKTLTAPEDASDWTADLIKLGISQTRVG